MTFRLFNLNDMWLQVLIVLIIDLYKLEGVSCL